MLSQDASVAKGSARQVLSGVEVNTILGEYICATLY